MSLNTSPINHLSCLDTCNFPSNPIIISSVNFQPPNGDGDGGNHHLMVVDKIVSALTQPLSYDQAWMAFPLKTLNLLKGLMMI